MHAQLIPIVLLCTVIACLAIQCWSLGQINQLKSKQIADLKQTVAIYKKALGPKE